MAQPFVQLFQNTVKALSSRLTPREKALLWDLTAYIDRRDNSLQGKFGPLGVEEIARICGISRQHASAALKRLVELGVILEERSGRKKQFHFAPTVAHRYTRTRRIREKEEQADKTS